MSKSTPSRPEGWTASWTTEAPRRPGVYRIRHRTFGERTTEVKPVQIRSSGRVILCGEIGNGWRPVGLFKCYGWRWQQRRQPSTEIEEDHSSRA